MTASPIPLVVLALMAALTIIAPLVAWKLRRDTGYVLAAGYLAVAVVMVTQTRPVIHGQELTTELAWIPGLGVSLSLRVDALSFLFACLILIVGAVVMAYSARYLKPREDHASFYGLLALFAASMLGLVIADDAVAMFVFWELTSIASFFLIGLEGGEAAKPAGRALLVTSAGGLALLAGLVLMGVAAGTYEISGMVEAAASIRSHPAARAALFLVLAGSFTKSAQVPFHFWLPGAMVAPTPVSTYLHAATMVKAGLYLLARLSPVFNSDPLWLYVVVPVGLITAVVGAALALKQHDLKSLLAYSTVSQLGFIAALIGIGTHHALAAATAHIIAHAAYKATLFMVVGIVDKEAGSRDIRDLSGVWRLMPLTATTAGLAALSMAGFPPFIGFISKEEAFSAWLDAPVAPWMSNAFALAATAAAVLTFAYGARIFYGAFAGPVRQDLYEPGAWFLGPAAVTSVIGVAAGVGISMLDPLANAIGNQTLAGHEEVHLAMWHGFTGALLLSALTIAGGTVLLVMRNRVDRFMDSVSSEWHGSRVLDVLHDATISVGVQAGRPFLTYVPGLHLSYIFVTALVLAVGAALIAGGMGGSAPPSPARDWLVTALLALSCAGVAVSRERLAAVALLAGVGFLVASYFVLLGAPDLALTQLLVETLTVVVIVLVFRRMPRSFTRVRGSRTARTAALALATGIFAGVATYALTGRRPLSDAGAYFLSSAEEEAGGVNVVNTILVDFRALDTLGEITVLVVAAVGLYSLVRLTRRELQR